MATNPTHEQAQLQLQIYDLRREERLRQARDWFFKNYRVKSVDDAMRIAAPDTQGGTYTMMVTGYWEQACALLNYGLLHEDLFFETNGEFFGVWEMVKPVVPDLRKMFKEPHFLSHLEKAAKRFEEWSERRSPGHVAAMREWMAQQETAGSAPQTSGRKEKAA